MGQVPHQVGGTGGKPQENETPWTAPQHLVDALRAGDCVAFIGAGFSRPAVPDWQDLLVEVATELGGPVFDDVLALLPPTGRASSETYELVAEMLDEVHSEAFRAAIRRRVASVDMVPIAHRLQLLRTIPFAAILTTNFDGLLGGEQPSPDAYRRVLRSRVRWTDPRYWDPAQQGDERPHPAPIVALHGLARGDERFVLTHRDYRARLFEEPGYLAFLRAVFATRTVLFLGFSFTDAYVNLLRSEVLAMVRPLQSDDVDPIAYAVMADVHPRVVHMRRRLDGMQILAYPSQRAPEERPHLAFDELLTDLARRSSPRDRLGALLRDKRILWVDDEPRNNEYGYQFLTSAAAHAELIEQVPTVDDGVRRLAEPDRSYDLVLTHFGYGRGVDGAPVAVTLLRALPNDARCAPVIVFASGDHADDNKRAALRAGAFDYCYEWSTLFASIEALFTPGSQRHESP